MSSAETWAARLRKRSCSFSNYTGYYYNTSSAPVLISIPTTDERAGNFSAFPGAIYDPAGVICTGSVCSKPAFAGNIIPPSRISSVAQSFQSYLPAPTNANINNNYLGSLPRSIHNNNVTAKVDYNLSDKDRIYGVLVRGKWVSDYTGNLMPTGTALPLPYTSSSGVVVEDSTVIQLHHTHVFSPNMLNTFSAAMTRLFIPILSNTAAGKYPEKAGLGGLPLYGQAADGFPTITFTGANSPSPWGGSPFNQAETNFAFQDNLQWVHRNHNLTFGVQISWLHDNRANPTSGTNAAFTFANNETAGFSPAGTLLTTTGNAYASYLLGAVDAATITNNNVVWTGSHMQNHALFVQDDWKVDKKLTLNLGLRWDLLVPYREQFNRISFLDPNLPNPAAAGRPGALVYGGSGPNTCNCSTLAWTHYKNFEPRIGIAWSLNEKTVLRGGLVMAYTAGAPMSSSGPGQTGYNAPSSYSSTATGLPSFYWDQGIPPGQSAPLLTSGFGTGFTAANPTGAVSVPYVDPKLSGRPPYYINWSGGFERYLPFQTVLSASYSASVGHFLTRDGDLGIWTNSMDPKYLVLGALLNAQATPANIAAAQAIVPAVTLPFSTFKGTIAQMLRPFPQYSGVSCYSCDLGNSTYQSLQITLNRRLSHQLTVQAAYTLSKELDNIPNSASLGSIGGTRNPYNGGLDKAPGAIDRRHIAHALFVYNLPAAKRITFSPLRAVAANWSVSGILTFSSGAPLAITGSGCNDPGVNSTCIASYNPSFTGLVRVNGSYGSGNALAPGATAYLAKNAFMNPPPYDFGNLPRSAPYGLFAPGLWNVDVTVRRDFPIGEHLRFSIAADFFNLPNAVVFAAPGTNIDTTNFGQVSTAANSPRKLQLNARITF